MALNVLENATRRAVNRLPRPASNPEAGTPMDAGTGFTFRRPQGPTVPYRDPQVPSGGDDQRLPAPRIPNFSTPGSGGNSGIGGGDPNRVNVQPSFSGNRFDDRYINSMIGQWAQLPGADPSLQSDPGYWNRRIRETGGLGPDNTAYWEDMGLNNYKRPPHGQSPSGGGNLGFLLQLLASRMGSAPQMGTPQMGLPQMPSVQTPYVDINAIVQQAMRGY